MNICIGDKNIDEYFDKNTITCFENGKMKIFHVFDAKNQEQENNRFVYLVDDNGVSPISQEEISKKLDNGMEIFSKTKNIGTKKSGKLTFFS